MASADGALSLYEKDADEARMYHAARRLPMDGGADALGQGLGLEFGAAPRARSLALTAAEDALLLTLASRQLLSLNLGAAELAKVGKTLELDDKACTEVTLSVVRACQALR